MGGVGAGGPAGEAGGGAGRWMTTGVVAAGAGTVAAGGAARDVATIDSAGEAAGVGTAGIGVCAGAGADVPAGEQAAVISTAAQAPETRRQPDLCSCFGVVISNFLNWFYCAENVRVWPGSHDLRGRLAVGRFDDAFDLADEECVGKRPDQGHHADEG